MTDTHKYSVLNTNAHSRKEKKLNKHCSLDKHSLSLDQTNIQIKNGQCRIKISV